MSYNAGNPADTETIANGPAVIRENFRALKDDKIVNAQKVMDYSPGNASGNIPVSNGALNANLNANLLEGQHASAFAPAGWVPPAATTASNGAMSNTDKQKLDNIAAGAEVNQNAFSNVKVGSITIQADAKTDTLEIVAGAGITLTPDATGDKVTITITQDGHSHAVATISANGFMSNTDKQRLDSIATGAEVNQNAFTIVAVGGASLVADSKTDTLTINAGEGITITGDAANDALTITVTPNGHTHQDATASAPGFMTASGMLKLNGIAAGAEVNQNAFGNILVGSTTIQADAKTDTLELVGGTNIALTPDATNDRVTIAVTGTVANAAACTGNAATATKLATARTIALTGGVTGSATFDGSANASIATTIAGNAPTATKLATVRTINGVAFDGSANITVTAAANGGNADTVGGAAPGTGANNVLKLDSGGKVPVANLPISSIQQPLIILNDTKANGANGGTFTAGAWQQRTLNTLVIDQTGQVTLSNNQFTLSAGTYEIQASAPAAVVNYHQARLKNVTDGTSTVIGTSEYSPNGPANRSSILGAFTIAASKVFQIEHYCTTSSSDIGFGKAASIGVGEVYTTVLLRKLA